MEWQLCPDVVEVLEYVRDFRVAHAVEMENPGTFCSDELGAVAQYVLGELIPTREFSGSWIQLANAEFARQAAECVRGLRPRLERYIQCNLAPTA